MINEDIKTLGYIILIIIGLIFGLQNMTSIVDKYIIPSVYKKTRKHSEEKYTQVFKMYELGYSIHSISRELGISKRMVQFKLFPDRYIKNKKDFAKRQKTGIYRYDTYVQSELVANTRQYKKILLKDNKLIKKI